jgi:hypothetical protein
MAAGEVLCLKYRLHISAWSFILFRESHPAMHAIGGSVQIVRHLAYGNVVDWRCRTRTRDELAGCYGRRLVRGDVLAGESPARSAAHFENGVPGKDEATGDYRVQVVHVTDLKTLASHLYGAKTWSRRQDVLVKHTTEPVATPNANVASRRRDR